MVKKNNYGCTPLFRAASQHLINNEEYILGSNYLLKMVRR